MLKTTKMVLTWLSLLPADNSTSTRKKIAYIVVSVIALSVTACCIPAYLIFVWKFKSIDLENALAAFTSATSLVGTDYIFIIIFISRRELLAVFEKLSAIQDSSKQSNFFHSFRTTIFILNE